MRTRPRVVRVVRVVVALAVALTGLASSTGRAATPAAGPARAASTIEESWGVQIEGIHLSAGGYLLDFRYCVLDPEKARPILDRSARPFLVDEASGRTLIVPDPPKVGPLRPRGEPVEGKSYFVLFGNPGKFIKAGSKVTVVIGDFRAPALTVE